jgi:predicted Zn-dependent protease
MERSTFSKITTFVFYTVIICGVFFSGYKYQNEVLFVLKTDAWKIRPCSFTTSYSLGTFDTRFGITKEEFLADIETATSMWDRALNRRLFIYKESGGDITVNLIYDKRQKTTDALEEVSGTIKAGRAEYEAIKAQYSPLVATYERDKESLQIAIDEYKTKTDSYNQSVAYWNAHGGAPKNEYDQLAIERSALDQDASNLKQKQSDLNAQVPVLNKMVADMNEIISKYNLSIKTYNNVGGAIGKEFDEGEYEQTFGKRTISIYQFNNDNKLIRVLAHEFGHALGLDHVDDTEAIMYYLNESTGEDLTDTDIEALKANCRIK